MVGGCAALRVAAHLHSEAAGVTGARKIFPGALLGIVAMLVSTHNREESEITMRVILVFGNDPKAPVFLDTD
jgi:hypothetical protein